MTARPPPGVRALPGGGFEAVFELTPAFAGFDGHFPDEPVLPGMCHVDLALHGLEVATGRPARLREIRRARFRRKVVPGDVLVVALTPGDDEPGVWRARHTVRGERVAELELVCGDDDRGSGRGA